MTATIYAPTQAAPQAALICAIEVRNVYGKALAYPDNGTAELFAGMLGRRTLTRRDLDHVQALGFEIVSRANADWRECA